MQMKVTRQGPVTIIHPAAQVDGRAAFQFEQDVLELLQGGVRYAIVDFSAVTLLASAGIRVLILMLHKVEARDGVLVLSGLTTYVKNVLDVSGLTGQFTIVASIPEALRCMPTGPDDASDTAVLARRVAKLLSIGDRRPSGPAGAALPESVAQPLADRVLRVLSRRR